MSSAARAGAGPAAGASAGAGAAPGGRQPRQQSDWRWTIIQSLVIYVALQFVIGPNGLIAKMQNKQQPTQADGTASPSAAATAPSTHPGAPKGPHLPLAKSLWHPDQSLDLYIFLTQAPPPTQLDILAQYSQWTHYGLGPYAAGIEPPINFKAPAYEPLLKSGAGSNPGSVQISTFDQNQLPAVKVSNIAFSQSKIDQRIDLGEFPISDAVRTGNHSIWAEIILCISGASPDPADPTFSPLRVHRQRKLLTRLFARKKRRIERNLFDKANDTLAQQLAEEEADDDFDEKNPPIGSHWHRNLSLAMVPHTKDQKLVLFQEPPATLQYIFPVLDPSQAQEAARIATHDSNMRFLLPVLNEEEEQGDKTSASQTPEVKPQPGVPTKTAYHYPILYPNDFWLMRGHMNPINHTVKSLPLHISLYTTSQWKFKLQASANEGWERAQNGQATGLAGQAGTAEIDMIKSMLLETSPWWLILTVVVSLLHSLFEMLAFSSDIGDWRKKSDLSGISIGSILTNVITQVIILLYLLDSQEETSFMIIAGQGMGAAIEAWKLTKAVKVAVVRTPRDAKGLLSLLPYQIKILNKRVPSEEEKITQEYDRLAFKLVGMVAVPVLGAWTVYSALYKEHRGWWSFVIQTLTSFVYFFGFASMVPQLIVNYKLKSTAGFSSKTFVYKILGTVVDDFFAFAIPQPTLHRLACFRDDCVFAVALYQRWLYGVDTKRKNEFGEIVDKEGAKRKELAAAAGGEKKVEPEATNGRTDDAARLEDSSTTALDGAKKGRAPARRR